MSEQRITLSLVSHTNVGKTTLARTLLRRDVGEVLDQAHVTDQNTAYPLIASENGELILWDTPGFGDSVRLLRRLQQQENPIGWFVSQVWDRFTDRPLWCAQQAASNVRQEADVVLYLVNDSEEPSSAGYVDPELELLSWMERPIVVLLNQSGEALHTPRQMESRLALWRHHCQRWPRVVEIMALDAFSRCWVQEGSLFEALLHHLPVEDRPLMEELLAAWNQRNLDIFHKAVAAMAGYLATAATDRESLPLRRGLSTGLRKKDRQQGMATLARRLQHQTEELMAELLLLHGLEGQAGEDLETAFEAFLVRGELLETEKSALLGGVVSGAVGGLAADLLAGGLTFGGGVVAGAILGALGGAGLAKGYRELSGDKTPAVAWSPAFLDELGEQLLLRYLAVAHFGRGRGEFQREEAHGRWREAVSRQLSRQHEALQRVWKDAQRGSREALAETLTPILHEASSGVLTSLYPRSSAVLG